MTRFRWFILVNNIISVILLFSSLHPFIALFITYWLSFISSRSLLNLSYIFSILVCRLFICDSILISRFWINFTIIIRNSLSGRFPISSSFVWFGGHLSCSFTCWVFLCLFILFKLLSLGCPFCILAVWKPPSFKNMFSQKDVCIWCRDRKVKVIWCHEKNSKSSDYAYLQIQSLYHFQSHWNYIGSIYGTEEIS